MSIKIDSEFQSLIPPLTDDEFQRLEKSILAEGVREPIITWDGTIIDGHNRYKICTKHGLSFKTAERDFSSRDEAILFIIANQLARRNLPVAAIGLLKLKEKEIVANQAEQRRLANLKQGNVKPDTPNLGERESKHDGETFQQLAKDIPLGRESLRKLDAIDKKAKEGNPVAIKEREQLMSGEKKSIHGSYIKVAGKQLQRSPKEIVASDGRKICAMCGEPINDGDCIPSRQTVHRWCEQEYQRDWEKEKRVKPNRTDDNRRICSICGEPIDEGGHYTDKLNWHYKCGLERENENQRKYRDAGRTLRENKPKFTLDLLLTELTWNAEKFIESWTQSIKVYESTGVKLRAAEKMRLEKAAAKLLIEVNKIKERTSNA